MAFPNRQLIVAFMILAFSAAAKMSAGQEFKYGYTPPETLSYSVNVMSSVDMAGWEAIAAMLQLRSLAYSAYLVFALVPKHLPSQKEMALDVTCKQAEYVLIKNDSLMRINQGVATPVGVGTTYFLAVDSSGKMVSSSAADPGNEENVVQIWQMLLPRFPSGPLAPGRGWQENFAFYINDARRSPKRLTCQVNYTYSGAEKSAGKQAHRFDYSFASVRDTTHGWELSGTGRFVFDRKGGRILTNSCMLHLRGFFDLSTLGLPMALSGVKVPLGLRSRVTAKLKNET